MRMAGPHGAACVTKGAIMFHTHRKALGSGLATALTLAVTAAPAALAQPFDVRSPDARDASAQRATDLRSPDARDAAQDGQIVVAGPPAWPANPQPITRPLAVASAPSSGLDWGSAGIGAVAGVGACAISLVGIGGLRRRRVARSGSLT
jgi:hypothetical protein